MGWHGDLLSEAFLFVSFSFFLSLFLSLLSWVVWVENRAGMHQLELGGLGTFLSLHSISHTDGWLDGWEVKWLGEQTY